MPKMILVFLLTLNSALGAVILEKHAQSGYVIPEYSFTKDCRLSESGLLESVTVKGDGTALGFSKMLPQKQVRQVQKLLKSARKGKIDELPMPCDIGTKTLKGYYGGELVELDMAIDCGMRRLNLSRATSKLSKFAEKVCNF